MTKADRRYRDAAMSHERMRGATLRAIAKRHGLSKSRVHQIVSNVEILPPPPVPECQLVQLPGGGYTARYSYTWPRSRAYKVRERRRIYPLG